MSKINLIGRVEEIAILEQTLVSPVSEFVAVYGRRRVGKTRKNVFITLITSFGLVQNAYSRELVASSLTLDDLF
jgi:AAA+ ATPase superfamily predicted ATPase